MIIAVVPQDTKQSHFQRQQNVPNGHAKSEELILLQMCCALSQTATNDPTLFRFAVFRFCNASAQHKGTGSQGKAFLLGDEG